MFDENKRLIFYLKIFFSNFENFILKKIQFYFFFFQLFSTYQKIFKKKIQLKYIYF